MHHPGDLSSSERPARSEVSYEGDATLHAREIARQAGFDHALQMLEEHHLLTQEVARVKAHYEKRLFDAESFMTEATWEAFTIIELFHPETADHCIETYRLAHGKVERHLLGSDVLFSELFAEEQVTLPVFYRACLLHDIGKVNVPYHLITNAVTDHECARLLTLHQDEASVRDAFARNNIAPTDDPDALIRALSVAGHRPKDIAPAFLLLSPAVASALTEQGIDVHQTLAELMRPHEAYSASILAALGFPEESQLAARHHNYQHLSIETPVAVGGLGVSVDFAEILHLADMEQAMEAHRTYKSSATHLEAMETLIHHAEQGTVNADITTVWVRDEIDHFYHSAGDLADVMHMPTERAHLAAIVAFLEKHNPVHLGTHTTSISIPSLDLA